MINYILKKQEIMISTFKSYKDWCKYKGLKPSNPNSLKAYLKYMREEC